MIPQLVQGELVDEIYMNNLADDVNAIIQDGLVPNIEFSTDRTLELGDRDNMLILTGATNRTATVPNNDVVAFDIGAVIAFCQGGTGELTIASAAGVTIHSENSRYKTRGQHAICAILKTATNTWRLFGNTKP